MWTTVTVICNQMIYLSLWHSVSRFHYQKLRTPDQIYKCPLPHFKLSSLGKYNHISFKQLPVNQYLYLRVVFPRTSDQSNIQPHSPHKSKGGTEIDGSSVEIIENESLHSTLNTNPAENKQQRSQDSPSKKWAPKVNSKPPMAPTLEERRSCFSRGRCMTSIPLQYFHQSTIPRSYLSKLNYQPQMPPVGVVVPSYDAVLFNDTWQPGVPRYAYPESAHVRPYATLNIEARKYHQRMLGRTSERSETTSASTIASEEHLHGVKCSRPRSMSLSASETSRSTSPSSDSEPGVQTNKQVPSKTQNKASAKQTSERFEKQLSPSRTASPFDSGNDSVKSIPSTVAAAKKQSLTLV